MDSELQYSGLITAFISFLYIIVRVINQLNISGEMQCFGLIFSVRRADEASNAGNTTNTITNNNTNDITQEVEVEYNITQV